MLLQKNYNPSSDAPLWEDYTTKVQTPDEVVELLRRTGATGEYRLLYVSHGQIAEQRFIVERYDEFKVRHKATRRKAVDTSQSGSNALGDGASQQQNPPGDAHQHRPLL